jgi:hypothetical protein
MHSHWVEVGEPPAGTWLKLYIDFGDWPRDTSVCDDCPGEIEDDRDYYYSGWWQYKINGCPGDAGVPVLETAQTNCDNEMSDDLELVKYLYCLGHPWSWMQIPWQKDVIGTGPEGEPPCEYGSGYSKYVMGVYAHP